MEQYKEDQTGEWLFSIPLDNKSLSIRILYYLFCIVAENLLWKIYYMYIECMEKKKKEQIQRIKYKRRLVLYPTIQLVSVNMYIKYAISILYHWSDT